MKRERILKNPPVISILHNKNIRALYMDGFTRTLPVTTIVIHGTGGGYTLPWIANAVKEKDLTRVNRYKKGIALFHYLIGQDSPEPDGQIIEIICPTRWVYHSSVGGKDGGSIGIELLNRGAGNTGTYSNKQLESLSNLVAYLVSIFPTINEVVGHGRNMQRNDRSKRGAWKVCPGKNFPWEIFQEKLQEKFDATIQRDERFESVWW